MPTDATFSSEDIIPVEVQQDVASLLVTIGEVPIDNDDALFLDDDSSDAAIWTDYKIINRYEDDLHRYMAGVTAPGGFNGASCSFFQLAAPTLLWISDWTACRFDTIPEVPDSELSLDSNWVLLDRHFEPAMIVLAPDGVTPLYRLSGTYFYGNKNPSSNTIDDLTFPIPPWLDAGSLTRSIDSSAFGQDLNDLG